MAKGSKVLAPHILGILSRLVVTQEPMAWVARITDGQLDRKDYVALNDALVAMGGAWHKGVKGHLFAEDPTEAIEAVLLTGRYDTKWSGDFFQTPEKLAAKMATWAVHHGDRVLEPSAGAGRLVHAALAAGARSVTCVEKDPKRAEALSKQFEGFPVTVLCADFMSVVFNEIGGIPFDSVVMNPPFSRSADAQHIERAARFLKSGGRLAAVAGAGLSFRQTAAYKEARTLVGETNIEPLPDRTFSAEGTDVSTVLVSWVKP